MPPKTTAIQPDQRYDDQRQAAEHAAAAPNRAGMITVAARTHTAAMAAGDLPVGRGGDLDQARIAAGLMVTAGHAAIMLCAECIWQFRSNDIRELLLRVWADLTGGARRDDRSAAALARRRRGASPCHISRRLAPEAQPPPHSRASPALELVAESRAGRRTRLPRAGRRWPWRRGAPGVRAVTDGAVVDVQAHALGSPARQAAQAFDEGRARGCCSAAPPSGLRRGRRAGRRGRAGRGLTPMPPAIQIWRALGSWRPSRSGP